MQQKIKKNVNFYDFMIFTMILPILLFTIMSGI